MNRYLLILVTIISSFRILAQEQDSIFIQLYGIGGNYAETSNGTSLSSSMGELMVTTTENYNQTLTQGFQQNNFTAVVGIIEMKDLTFNVEAFPNPTTEFLNIKISGLKETINTSDYKIEFIDLLGKQISLEQNIIDDQTLRIDLKELPEGMYMVNVRNIKSSKLVSTFKITKTTAN
jgi:hypothetical protein